MKFGIICFLGDKKESALAFFHKRHLDGCVNCTIVLGDFLCPLRGARLVAKSKQGDVAVLAAGRGREAGSKNEISRQKCLRISIEAPFEEED